MDKAIWLSWHLSRRTKTLSKALDIPLVAKQKEGGILSRHLVSFLWTIRVLVKSRPKVIFIQYSYLLLIAVAAYKTLSWSSVTVVCDCHTKALRRSISGILSRLYDWIKIKSFSCVDICVISNSGQKYDALKYSSSLMIMPDPIPDLAPYSPESKSNRYIVFVCSFDSDEPVGEILQAANDIARTMPVYITGRAPRNTIEKFSRSENVHFTGFISDNEYERLIAGARCIVSCTTEEGCLQSSGYEALAVEVPFVTSATEALREYFGNSVEFVKNDKESIVKGILLAAERSVDFTSMARNLKKSKISEFKGRLIELRERAFAS